LSNKDCRYFEECSCPICPEDESSLAGCAWFPDEDVCRRGDFAGTAMVRNQKRIARATRKDFERGCFTAAMLQGITKIGQATRGLDPETEITPERVKKWLSGFKVKPPRPALEPTEAQLAVRAAFSRAQASRKGASGLRADAKIDKAGSVPVGVGA
jgi:hypothetical protein